MLEKEDIVKGIELTWSGIFNLADLYEGVKGWLDIKGFGDETKNFLESNYSEKIQGDTKSLEIKWTGERKADTYFNFLINISILIVGLKELEVKQDTKNISANKGEITIRIDGILVKDPDNKMNPIIQKLYEKLIIKNRLEGYREDLYKLVYALHKTIKEFLTMRI